MLYDTGTQVSFCDETFAAEHNLEIRETTQRACTQAGVEIPTLGEATTQLRVPKGTVSTNLLVIPGAAGVAAISEADGRKMGIYVAGIPPSFVDDINRQEDDEGWVAERTTKPPEEHKLDEEKLRIIMDIVQPALNENAKLPDSTYCKDPKTIHRIDIKEGLTTWTWQYPIARKILPKVDARINEWGKNEWMKAAKPGNPHNIPLTAAPKKSGGIVAFDDI